MLLLSKKKLYLLKNFNYIIIYHPEHYSNRPKQETPQNMHSYTISTKKKKKNTNNKINLKCYQLTSPIYPLQTSCFNRKCQHRKEHCVHQALSCVFQSQDDACTESYSGKTPQQRMSSQLFKVTMSAKPRANTHTQY